MNRFTKLLSTLPHALLLVSWCICLCCCSNDKEIEPLSPPEPSQAYHGPTHYVRLSLDIKLPNFGVRKSPDINYGSTSTAQEGLIKSLTVFVADVDAESREYLVAKENVKMESDNVDHLNVDLNLIGTSGYRRIYVAANINPEYVTFDNRGPLIKLPPDKNTHPLSLIADIDSETGSPLNLPMFATLKSNQPINGDSTLLSVEALKSGEAILESVILEHILSKVYITFMPDYDSEGKGDCLKFSNGGLEENSPFRGWAPTDSIFFLTETFPYEIGLKEPSVTVIDDYISFDSLVHPWNKTEYDKFLTHLSAYTSSFWLNKDFQNKKDKPYFDSWDKIFIRKATAYDATRVGEESSNPYTEGLYLPEHLVRTQYNTSGINPDSLSLAARIVTPHIIVAVKFYPSYIHYNGSYSEYFSSISQVKTFLRNHKGPKLPPETYYLDTKLQRYCSYEEVSSTDHTGRYLPYYGGWHYFYVMLGGEVGPKNHPVYTNLKEWGPRRGNYYIFNINTVTFPGASNPAHLPVYWDYVYK